MSKKKLFKIIFHNQGKIYEIFAGRVDSSGIYGFVEVSGLVFDNDRSLVVDPTEEKIRAEFSGVKNLHLPMHSVVRIE